MKHSLVFALLLASVAATVLANSDDMNDPMEMAASGIGGGGGGGAILSSGGTVSFIVYMGF